MVGGWKLTPEQCANKSAQRKAYYANGGDRSCLTGRPAVPPEVRFWKKVKKTVGCWFWLASTDRGGYGQFNTGDGMKKAHVFSYMLHKGRVPDGKLVCHSCDNPACVKPDHLWLGTYLENNHDMIRKGRARYLSGPANPAWKIGRRRKHAQA